MPTPWPECCKKALARMQHELRHSKGSKDWERNIRESFASAHQALVEIEGISMEDKKARARLVSDFQSWFSMFTKPIDAEPLLKEAKSHFNLHARNYQSEPDAVLLLWRDLFVVTAMVLADALGSSEKEGHRKQLRWCSSEAKRLHDKCRYPLTPRILAAIGKWRKLR